MSRTGMDSVRDDATGGMRRRKGAGSEIEKLWWAVEGCGGRNGTTESIIKILRILFILLLRRLEYLEKMCVEITQHSLSSFFLN